MISKTQILQIERISLQKAQQILSKLRTEALKAYKSDRPDGFSAKFVIDSLVPVITRAAALNHVAGQQLAIHQTRKALREQIKADLIDSVAKLLKKGLSVDLKKVEKAYKAVSLTALTNYGVAIEKKVKTKVAELITKGVLLKDAIEELDEVVGKGKVAEHLLETVFRTQLQTSYNAGQWQANQDPDIQEILWGYKYVTAGDDRVREEHAELDGATLLKDDEFWLTYWPPNGWNCRCQVIPVFEEREIVRPDELPEPDEGFAYNPGIVLTDATTKADFKLGYSISFAFNEEDHPRGPDGKFGEGGGKSEYITGKYDKTVSIVLKKGQEDKFIESLTVEEAKALAEYKGDNPYAPGAAIALNGALREGQQLSKEQEEAFKHIQSAFQKAPRLKRDTVLHRGTSEIMQTDKSGFIDIKSPLSTSVNPETAEMFSTILGKDGYVYSIDVPANFVVMPTSKFHSGTTIEDEGELLLPPGASIKEVSRNGREIKLQVIGGQAWMIKSIKLSLGEVIRPIISLSWNE